MAVYYELIADDPGAIVALVGSMSTDRAKVELTEDGDLYVSIDLREPPGPSLDEVVRQAVAEVGALSPVNPVEVADDPQPEPEVEMSDDGLVVGGWVMPRYSTEAIRPVGVIESLGIDTVIVRWNTDIRETFSRDFLEPAPEPAPINPDPAPEGEGDAGPPDEPAADGPALGASEQRVLEHLRSVLVTQSIPEVEEGTGLTYDAARVALGSLFRQGLIQRPTRGLYLAE
jgi:hypothetical protein